MGLFPDEIVQCPKEEILTEIRKEVKRGVGLKKVRQLKDAPEFDWTQRGKRSGQIKIKNVISAI